MLTFTLLLTGIAATAELVETPAPTTAVTVFNREARVVRTAKVEVQGSRRLSFPLLPRATDEGSVRLEVVGRDGGVVEIEHFEIERLAGGDAHEAAAAVHLGMLEQIDLEVGKLKARLHALTSFDLDDGFSPLNEDDEDVMPVAAAVDAAGWKPVFDFQQDWFREQDGLRLQLQRELESVEGRRREAAASAKAWLARHPPGRLRVTAQVKGRGKASLALSYLVRGPTWRPVYDVHHQPGADTVEIAFAALVTQQTGEDWQDIDLSLSTAQPAQGGDFPALAAWRIGRAEQFVPTPARVTVSALPPPAGGWREPPTPPRGLRARLERRLAEEGPRFIGGSSKQNAYHLEGFHVNDGGASGGHEASRGERVSERFDEEFLDGLPLESRNVQGMLANQTADANGGTPTGVVTGNVFDQSGVPLKGVKITVKSSHVDGPKTVFTDEHGFFRVVGLTWGRFDLTATAKGLKTYVQKNLQIGHGQTYDLAILMEVESAEEEYVIVERPPVIETQSASVTEKFDEAFLDDERAPSSHGLARRPVVALLPPARARGVVLPSDSPYHLAGGQRLTYTTSHRDSILSQDGARRVALFSRRWPVKVVTRLYPGMTDLAYVTGDIKNPSKEPLPAGEARLHHGLDPAGAASLRFVAPGERFVLPLGSDAAVKPVRSVTQTTETKGFLLKDEVTTYVVDIELSNPHPRAIDVQLFDQIPISGDDSVTAKLLSASPGHHLDARSGRLRWDFSLAPGAMHKLSFRYALTRKEGRSLEQ